MEQFKSGENKEKMELEAAREALRKKVEIVKKKAEKNPACPDWMLADVDVDQLTEDDLKLLAKSGTDESLKVIKPDELVRFKSEQIIPHLKKKEKTEKELYGDKDIGVIGHEVLKDSRVIVFDWIVQKWNDWQFQEKHAKNVARRKEAERNKNNTQGEVA